MTAFGTTPNPGSDLDEDGNPLFSGSLQENHTIPREVFSGTNPAYAEARQFLDYIDFDGQDADRNSNWVPANERDALATGSGMHRGSHPRYSDFMASKIVEIGRNHQLQINAIKAEIASNFPDLNDSQLTKQAWLDPRIKNAMDADINRLIATVPELLQRIGPDGKPLMVFNNSDPRAPDEADRIMQRLDEDYRFYEPDGNGGFRRGDNFQQLASYNDPSQKGLLDFTADGRPIWTDRYRAEFLSRREMIAYFAQENGEIDKRAFVRKADSANFRAQVERTESMLRQLGTPNTRFEAGSLAALERNFVRTFRNSASKMMQFADYANARANLIIEVAQELGDRVPDFVRAGLKKAIDYHRNGDGTFNGTRVGVSLAAGALAVANLWVAWERHENAGGDFESFAREQGTLFLTGLPVAGAVVLAAMTPAGPAVLFTVMAVGTFAGIKEVIDYLVTPEYGLDQAGETFKFLKSIDIALDAFEATIKRGVEGWSKSLSLISNDPYGFGEFVLEKLVARSIEWSGGENAAIPGEDNDILIGDDLALLAGDDADNVMAHRSAGEVYGGDGGDILLGWLPEVLRPFEALDRAVRDAEKAGKSEEEYAALLEQYAIEKEQFEFELAQYERFPDLYPEPPQPPAWMDAARVNAEHRLLLDGGEDNDWVLALGGEGAVTAGGLGQDWIWNRSAGGILWGDIQNSVEIEEGTRGYFVTEVNAEGEEVKVLKTIANDASNADSFWFAKDVTLMDAQGADRLRYYGLPLLGGDTTMTTLSLAASAFISPYAGFALSAATGAFNLAQASQGRPLVYYDRFVPGVTYMLVDGAEPGTQDLLVGDVTDFFWAVLFGDRSAMPQSAQDLRGVMKVVDFDRGEGRFFASPGDLGIALDDFDPMALLNLVDLVSKGVPLLQSQVKQFALVATALSAANDNECEREVLRKKKATG